MDGGGNAILLIEFLGITGLTLGLAVHQLWRLKQFELRQQSREREAEEAGPAA